MLVVTAIELPGESNKHNFILWPSEKHLYLVQISWNVKWMTLIVTLGLILQFTSSHSCKSFVMQETSNECKLSFSVQYENGRSKKPTRFYIFQIRNTIGFCVPTHTHLNVNDITGLTPTVSSFRSRSRSQMHTGRY